jgi:hypothetical protein
VAVAVTKSFPSSCDGLKVGDLGCLSMLHAIGIIISQVNYYYINQLVSTSTHTHTICRKGCSFI